MATASTASTAPEATTSTAKAPTGDILAFVEAFNKEFDKVIEELKVEVNDAKLILASVSTITQLKQCRFPEGNPSVKTIGDLYKYTYNLDTLTDLTPEVKYFSGQVDLASAEIRGEFDKDVNGDTMVPKENLKPFKSKILGGLNRAKSLNRKLKLKEPQGKNPNLWSPGLYYFEYLHSEIKTYIKNVDEYHFSIEYLSALRNGKETFTFSISNFSKDGDILIKGSPFKERGFSSDDGQAGYWVFDSILQSKMENPYYTDMSFIATLGFQDNNQMTGLATTTPKVNKTSFEGLKTLYLSGKVEDLKSNPKFQLTRGELSEDKTYFYGNWELIGLYKAFIQAGDDYEYVTFPFKKEETEATSTGASPSNAITGTESSTTTTTTAEPRFIFNVEDDKTFFCKEPAMELFIIPATNDVSQPAPVYRPEDEITAEDMIDEEFLELPILSDDLMLTEGEPEIKSALGTELEYNELPNDNKPPTTTNQTTTTQTTTTQTTSPPAPVVVSGPSGESPSSNYQNPSGVSEKEWNKNGTIIKGSKVPASISKPPNYNQKVKLNKTIQDEYIPVIKGITGYSVGAKLLAICMAQKEGFVGPPKSTRSYRTNNPGNIGNTDSGSNKELKTLKDGILLQLDYITKVAEGKHSAYPMNQRKLMKPYYSPEIAANNKPGGSYAGMTEYLPGYDFIYTGRIEQYCKIYATGARATNGYISMICSWFRQNGFTSVHEETTLKELISFNGNVSILN